VAGLDGFVLTFLANALWQAPALAAAAWAGAQLLRRAPAAYRHRLWVAALALVLLVPLLSAARLPNARTGPSIDLVAWSAPGLDGQHSGGAAGAGADRRAGSAARWPAALARAVSAGYALFVLALAARLARAWRKTHGIVRATVRAPEALSAIAGECARRLEVRAFELRVGNVASAPLTFGVHRPVIVLPEPLTVPAGATALRGILAHELAHVRRNDCALNLLCELVALPLLFHPAVRLLRRRIAGAREAACDEAAAAVVGPRAYAEVLLETAVRSSRRKHLLGALGTLDGEDLEDRMKKVLEDRAPLGRPTALALLAAAVALTALLGRGVAASAVQVATGPGPADMVGTWKGVWAEGAFAGQPAADLEIALGPDGPVIGFTMYRYRIDSDKPPDAQRPTVVGHTVEKGVLHFRTRDKLSHHGEPPETMEAEWEFSVVGKDSGELRVRVPKHQADRAKGKDVPPPPPPLAMRRVRAAPSR
jgi:D-alanyl-D-alanine endopeptidase (penicillin-binding protein 7)